MEKIRSIVSFLVICAISVVVLAVLAFGAFAGFKLLGRVLGNTEYISMSTGSCSRTINIERLSGSGWVPDHQLTTAATLPDQPVWPVFTPTNSLRESGRFETCVVTFHGQKPYWNDYNMSVDSYAKAMEYPVGSTYTVKIVGGETWWDTLNPEYLDRSPTQPPASPAQ